MKKVNLLSAAKAVFTFIIFAGILTACSNSTSSGEEEHEPVGFVVYEQDVIVYTQDSDNPTTEVITVPASDSLNLRIAFIDEDGEVFTPEESEHSLSFETSNGTGEISITQENSVNQPFRFTLNGLSEGEAAFSFSLLHVGAEEFGPVTVPVNITASAN